MLHYSFRYPSTDSSENANLLVVYWSTALFDYTDFTDIIESNIDGTLVPAAVVVILRDLLIGQAETQFNENSTAQARLGMETPIILLGYNISGTETIRRAIGGTHYGVEFELRNFQRRAVTSIFRKHQGFVDATPSYHFKNPSERHSTRFIRLANILSVSAEIGFLAFCSLQFIPTAAEIAYIDTPALHSLIYAIQEQLKYFDTSRNFQAVNFESYFNISQFDFKYLADAVFVISASSSGGLAERLVQEKSADASNIFHVLFLGPKANRFKIICNLEKTSENPDGYAIEEAVPASDCLACKAHSVAIPIQSDQFTFAGPQAEPLLIVEEPQHKDFKSFLNSAIGSHALRVGLAGSIQSVGDHKYFVCMSSLLNSSKFQEKVDYLIKRTFPISAEKIICANNDSKELANYIIKKISQYSQVELLKVSEIPSIETGYDRPIVVIADSVESGRSLQDISRRLRNISKDVPLVYLIGLAKTSGERSREALKSTLTFSGKPVKHIFEAVQSVCLPSSTGPHAWLEERELLLQPKFSDTLGPEAKEFFQTRIRELSNISTPLVDNLFLPNYRDGRLKLREGFAFWKDIEVASHSQADIYFTISAVLQYFRAQGHIEKPIGLPSIRSNWLQQTLIDPENFNRFNDDVIQASLLRAAHPRELNYSSSEALSRNILEIILQVIDDSKDNGSSSAAEFLLAIIVGRLRLGQHEMNRLLIVDKGELPTIVEALLTFIQNNKPY